MAVVLKKGDASFKFSHEEVEELKKVSRFVHDHMEFSDDMEDKVFNIETEDFTADNLKDAVDYLRALNFKPTVYRKINTNKLDHEVDTDFERNLAKKYVQVKDIKKLHSVGKYLQIRALQVFALIILGVRLKVDENQHNSLEQIKQAWNITQPYDMNVEKALKDKYDFLKGYAQ
jgi:hypothetical protein